MHHVTLFIVNHLSAVNVTWLYNANSPLTATTMIIAAFIFLNSVHCAFKLVNVIHAGHDPKEGANFVLHQPIETEASYHFKSKSDVLPQWSTFATGLTYKSQVVPDHTDAKTVLNFARLTYDSYFEPDDKNWIPVPGWNVSAQFGWDRGVGIRGYLFQDVETVY